MYVKSDVQTNRKENVPFFVSTKNHPKNKLLSAILYTIFFLFDSFDVLSRLLEQIKLWRQQQYWFYTY